MMDRWMNGFKSMLLLVLLMTGASAEVLADANADVGKDFLAQNAKKPGIMTTASGLQYQVISEGTGEKPSATDKVVVNYRGTFISGDEFDAGKGIGFPLNRVIAGWTEGLQLMKEGAKYRLFVPSDLAYGERGAGGLIPPNTALIFDVELVKVQKP